MTNNLSQSVGQAGARGGEVCILYGVLNLDVYVIAQIL